MTDEHRQKLLNWISTVVLCLGYLSLAPLVGFYLNSEVVFRLTHPNMTQYQSETVFWVLSDVITVFVAISVTMIGWHLNDVIERKKPRRFFVTKLVSYWLILVVMLVTFGGALVIHSGVLASLHCAENDPRSNVFVFCTSYPGRGFIPLVLFPWCLMTIVALAKGALAVASRVR